MADEVTLWQIKADAGKSCTDWEIRSVAELIRDGVLDKIQEKSRREPSSCIRLRAVVWDTLPHVRQHT